MVQYAPSFDPDTEAQVIPVTQSMDMMPVVTEEPKAAAAAGPGRRLKGFGCLCCLLLLLLLLLLLGLLLRRDETETVVGRTVESYQNFTATPSATPVTASPVTTAPVTSAPFTAASVPATSVPATPSPVIFIPITSAPTTSTPTTSTPTTSAPTSAPITSAPVPETASEMVERVVGEVALEGGNEFVPGTYQYQAREWLKGDIDASTATPEYIAQRYSLACIYFATNGVQTPYTDKRFGANNPVPGWNTTTGWLEDSDTCAWHGITCDESGTVNSVSLEYNGLTGGIPQEIGLLKDSLLYLDVSGNVVANKDEELAWIGELKKLNYLDVHFCNFEYDGVPSEIGQLTDLKALDISYCLFFGPLEGSTFENLKNLTFLEMGGNSYNSPLPREIAQLPNLQHLYVDNTHLTGDISFLEDMDSIHELWLDTNPGLTGSLPAELGEKTTLKSLSLSHCSLTGTIPSELAQLTGMEQLWIHNNSFTGTIPSGLGALTDMHTFQAHENNLTGEVPQPVCTLRDDELKILTVDCGGLFPEVYCDCCTCCHVPCTAEVNNDEILAQGLAEFLAEKGVVVGDSGPSFEAYKWLAGDSDLNTYSPEKILQRYALATTYFATNSASTPYTDEEFGVGAPVPGWITADGWLSDSDECTWYGVTCDEAGSVEGIDLEGNGLTGSWPPEVSLLNKDLEHLDIGGNIMDNEDSELQWLGDLTGLTHLDVHYNNFDYDGIPPYISNLTDLEHLDVSSTLFNGPLNGEIFSELSKLTYLDISHNSYNSSVPDEISQLPALREFYAQDTNLTDDLSFIGDMTQATVIWIDYNSEIKGSIPADIADATSLESLSITDTGIGGSIPTELALMTNIKLLWLSNNSITGTIPSELAALTDMEKFHTEGNHLGPGVMPEGICDLRDIRGGDLWSLGTDCLNGQPVDCDCCTCCQPECHGSRDGIVSASDSLANSGVVPGSERYTAQALAWLESDPSLQGLTQDEIIQRYALASTYFATNGVSTEHTAAEYGAGRPVPEWTNTDGWLSAASECTWHGVTCDDDGSVVGVDLDSNGLTGSMPTEFALLNTTLTHLDVGNNLMANEGEGLAWISSLSHLSHLDIQGNKFEADGVPTYIGKLSDLEHLDMSFVLFNGPLVGSTFTDLTKLTYLDVSGNIHNSSVPTEIAELPQLEYLYASRSHLVGDLEFLGLCELPSIREISLDGNPGLEGSIPRTIAHLTTLQSLSIANTGITGHIPKEFSLVTTLETLRLQGNELTGTIPPEIARLTSMVSFHTEDNDMTGKMPEGICENRDFNGGTLAILSTDCKEPNPKVECDCCTCCEAPCPSDGSVTASSSLGDAGVVPTDRHATQALAWLEDDPALATYSTETLLQKYTLASIYFATNSVPTEATDAAFGTGNPVPGWTNSDKWLSYEDHECTWHGITCDEEERVTGIDLSTNGLTGSFPPEVGNLKSTLTHLDISHNVIKNDNEDLSWLEDVCELTHLDIHSNSLKFDGIPTYIGGLTKLQHLDVSYCLFSGPLEGSTFSNLSDLRHLEIGGNTYNSPIPSEIGDLQNLRRFYADNTHLTGDLSFMIGMPAIFELWVDKNSGLAGTIPTEIGDLSTLESLSITDTNVSGPIPDELSALRGMQQMWLYNNQLTGTIPDALSALTNMHTFHTENNPLMTGEMPKSICENRDVSGGPLAILATSCEDNEPVACSCCTCCIPPCFGGTHDLTHAPAAPTSEPSAAPSVYPTSSPTALHSTQPSSTPSSTPSITGSLSPSKAASTVPSGSPSQSPTLTSSLMPSARPSIAHSKMPSVTPSMKPSSSPSMVPSLKPSQSPTSLPSKMPSVTPSMKPSSSPSMVPSLKPSQLPTSLPSSEPTIKASSEPSEQPTPAPTPSPTIDYKLIASNAITEKGVDLSGNCQSQAINWLGNNAMLSSYTEQKMLQRFALAVIHCSTNSVKTVYTDYTHGEGNDIPGWTHSDGWMTDVDECSWHGISCDETGAVTGIDLSSNGLTGSIPDEITLLNGSLKHLDISRNIVANEKAQLEWIGQLDKLTHLDVHFNNFHDDGLPSGLQHLTDLHFLDISYCLFFGELDGAIFKDMQKLRYLEMGGNDYNSPMPSEIVDLPILEHLYIDNTHLTGDLNWLSHCHSKNLFEVWVDKNPGVVGTIPWLIGEITSIESLSISSCGLTGTVPTELADLTGMQQLWLFNNTLTGTIPSELASLTSMHTFHVEDNKLVGTMPDEICELRPPFGGNGILGALAADCEGSQPEVSCDCCTCCQSPCL